MYKERILYSGEGQAMAAAPGPGKKDEVFSIFAESWYRVNRISWKPSVQRDFRSTLDKHLIPYFKDLPVAGINKWMIKEFRTGLGGLAGRKGGKLTNKRINNILGVLRMIMGEAVDMYGFNSPFTNLKPLAVRRTDIMPFAPDEVFLFLDHVPDAFRDYYIVRFFTGMRTAEIDGLKWKYVDLNARKILVRETWQSKQWVTPKTASSSRDIDMMNIVAEALARQMLSSGQGELVFPSKEGTPLDYTNVANRVWYPTLAKAGLAKRTPYQTRHTAATLWLASGENPEWVARQLGHSDTQMLFKVYSRFIPNLTRRDGSAFESFLEQKISGQEPTPSKNGKEEDV